MNNLITRQEEQVYYIYRHLRNDNGLPFYIGMGRKSKTATCITAEYARSYSKHGRNPHWENIVNKVGYTVEIMLEDLTKQEACDKEIEFIELYGRTLDGGILSNKNKGGDGNWGYKFSEEIKQLFREREQKTIHDHIRESVFECPNTGCWWWGGTVDQKTGVGVYSLNHKSIRAHRGMYEHFKQVTLTSEQWLIRTCNNKLCVNPDHIFVGIPGDNVRNMVSKGKQLRGDKSGTAILTETEAREIKDLLKQGVRLRDIGRRYNHVSKSTIQKIKSGKNWRWLDV
jgi:hypothetical protein